MGVENQAGCNKHIIPGFFNGKAFDGGCGSFLARLLPCGVYQACFFIQF